MQETISPVLPRRRFGSAEKGDAVAPNAFSPALNTTAAVMFFRNSRRDQRDFINDKTGLLGTDNGRRRSNLQMNFDNRLACRYEKYCIVECVSQNFFKTSICHISTSDPNNLWRRTLFLNELYEILVFRHDDCAGDSCFSKNLGVFRVNAAEIAHMRTFKGECLLHPRC
jgi:hypothetical protein